MRRRTTVEVNGKRFDVSLWGPESAGVAVASSAAKARKPSGPPAASGGGGGGQR